MNAFEKLKAIVFGVAAITGCETHAPPTPAVLEDPDETTWSIISETLADALGRAQVEIGPGNYSRYTAIPVLPPPLGPAEDRSLATPTYFDLMLIDGVCVAVRRDTGDEYALDGVSCRPRQN